MVGIKTLRMTLLLAALLMVAGGCLGTQRTRSGDARTDRPWYDEQAGESQEAQAERLRRLEEANERLEATLRRMHAELGGQLDALQSDMDILTVKIDAQDRWLNRLEELVRQAERAGVGMTGLPKADGPVTRFGPSGQITEAPATVWGTQANPPGDRSQLPLLPADERGAPGAATGPSADGVPGSTDVEIAGGQPADSSTAGAQPVDDGSLTDEARRLYEIAYQDLMRENYQLAMINFRSFLERYPHSALSDNAQYWIGEVHYAQGQYSVAIEEFRRVVEGFPGQEKVPAAYLKIALCFQKMQDSPTARRYLEYVIQNYPETREAQLARERLPEL